MAEVLAVISTLVWWGVVRRFVFSLFVPLRAAFFFALGGLNEKCAPTCTSITATTIDNNTA